MEKTVEFLQSKMKDNCKLEMKTGGKLVVTYEKDGAPYREDWLFMNDMDTAQVTYNESERSINMHCRDGEEDCVTRKFYKDKEKRFYARVNFAFDFSPEEAAVVMDALKHMILVAQNEKYKRTKPFE
ncbi:MAG: hypothetical protein H6585_04110 [Flavobacteriales bacterium]|nr:hypothetical protein [Flavobacteriales bacterium]